MQQQRRTRGHACRSEEEETLQMLSHRVGFFFFAEVASLTAPALQTRPHYGVRNRVCVVLCLLLGKRRISDGNGSASHLRRQ